MSQPNESKHDGNGHGSHGDDHGHGAADAIPESSWQDKLLLMVAVLAGLILLPGTLYSWSQSGTAAVIEKNEQAK
jgi:hypothetical protein